MHGWVGHNVYGAELERVLLDSAAIDRRVRELGDSISRDYAGRELLAVGILKGALIFLADLVRRLTVPVAIDFVAVGSYGAGTESSGAVRILKDLEQDIAGRHVLLVEDIVDTGLTLNYLLEIFRARAPASLRVCVLLDKPERRRVPVPIDYCGFVIPDEFVVGYGLDYNERYRHLADIVVLRREVYRGSSV